MERHSQKTRAIVFLSLALFAIFYWTSGPGFRHIPGITALSDERFWSSSAGANVDIMAPTLYSDHKYSWINENQKTTYALFHCISRGDCAQNQTKGTSRLHLDRLADLAEVVLIAQFDFIDPMEGGFIGGEAIWAGSTVGSLAKIPLFSRLFNTAIRAGRSGHWATWDTAYCMRVISTLLANSIQFTVIS
jgi:hypothetical protein